MKSIFNRHVGVIFAFLLGLSLGILGSPGWSSSEWLKGEDSPDGLEGRLRNLLSTGMDQSNDPLALRRLSRLYFDLGYGVYRDHEEKIGAFQEGARLARKSLEQEEGSADAHFLYAANLGSVTELQGVIFGALRIQELKRHVHRALELDPTYAPAHYMLGRMYEELPWFLGGDQEAAGEHLKKAVSLDMRYVPGHLDLGRWYLKQGYHQEAVQEFTWVVETPPREKVWIWERIHRPQAQDLLRQLHAIKESGRNP